MMDRGDSDYLTQQEEEVEALQSIFDKDFEDVRKNDKWKVPRPPEILIHLKPSTSSNGNDQVYASATLRAKFPKDYPDKIPELTIENVEGLGDEALKILTESLITEANQSVGEVMMFQLCELFKELLHKYNRPSLSVYEENMKIKNEKVEKHKRKIQELQKRRLDNQIREIEEERIRRKEEERTLKLDRQRKRDKGREELDTGVSTGFDASLSPSVHVSEINFTTKGQRTVYTGKCIDKRQEGNVIHVGIEKETGSLVVIHKWVIPYPGYADTKFPAETRTCDLKTSDELNKISQYTKIVKGVEQELHSLMKVSHPNLVAYLAMRYTDEGNYMQVDLLQEYVLGANLESKINGNDQISIDELKNISKQLLIALDYLHCHSVVHKNLKASSVTINPRGTVCLADFSIVKRLADLYDEAHIKKPSVTFIDDTILSKNSKKGDILNFGMLALSLIQGRCIKTYPPEIPNKLPSVFKDFLSKCLAIDDRLRLTASELLEHPFLTSAIGDGPELSPKHEAESPKDKLAQEYSCDSDSRSRDDKDPTFFPQPPQMLSRIHSEFEKIQWLGKGGFGNVVQVRNKVDGRFYAIKRILLDPRRSQFNKKITREVKLLSRLNHENVVRYYNSWIETLVSPDDVSTETTSSVQSITKTSDAFVNSLGMSDDIEGNAPPPATQSYSDWASIDNYSYKQDESDDDEDDDNELFDAMFEPREDEEESILFEGEIPSDKVINNKPQAQDQSTLETATTELSSLGNVPKRYLYIQMEFCEKSTLREAINDGLDDKRIWCLFREILFGLVHIHEQGMIHRDLKPQNIFLDHNNHIKIGDFGLATSHTGGVVDGATLIDLASSKSEGYDSAMTGRVGTALYVAPELNKSASKVSYNQKVDIYSLGIIFFEMCYSGLQTKMERVKVLGNLRSEEIKFPDNFNEAEKMKETQIIKWCLKHSPEKRPAANELLRSSLVPAPDLEKSNPFIKHVRQAFNDPHSAQQRYLMRELFSQHDLRKDDVFYDIDLHKNQFLPSQHLMQEKIHSILISLMQRHGAVKVTPPVLVPRMHIEDEDETETEYVAEFETNNIATFMDSCGVIVNLPYDLRMPFARYISRIGVTSLKRYAIEKVYRKVKIHRSHPRELWECAFDIVTPTVCNLIPEAEGISLVSEIIDAIPVLSRRSYKITVNHTVLLLAVFEYSGIPFNKHEVVKHVLTEAKSEKLSKAQLRNRLLDSSLSPQQVSTLFTFIYHQGPLNKIQSHLKNLTRNKLSSIAMHARQGLHELEALRKNLESFNVKLPVIVHLGFVHNLHQFSGVIFQVSAEIMKKKKTSNEVIAGGGRYDDLIEQLSIPSLSHAVTQCNQEESKDIAKRQHAFGVSVAVDKIVAHSLVNYQQSQITGGNTSDSSQSSSTTSISNVDVLVTAVGRNQLFHERMRILKNLWDAGIRAEMTLEGSVIETDSLEVLQEATKKQSISHLVILKDRSSTVKVRSNDPVQGFNKHNEKELAIEELVDHLLRKIKEVDDSTSAQRQIHDHSGSFTSAPTEQSQPLSTRSINRGTRRLNIEVLAPDKLAFNLKRRYEQQALTKLVQLPIFQHISGKAEIYGLAVDLPISAMKTFVQGLDMTKEDEFNSSVATIVAQLPKYKKYFRAIADEIHEARFVKEVALIILYSYKDDVYRLLS